jgi:TolA-binding protein
MKKIEMKMRYLHFIYANIFVLVLFFGFIFLGCGNSPNKLYTNGKALVEKPETLDKGLEKLKLFAEKFPGDKRAPEVIFTIASIYRSKGNYSAALNEFEKLNTTYSGSPEAYKGKFLVGYIYYEDLKDYKKAKDVLQDFIRSYPDSGLSVSAQVLIDNIGVPFEKWSVMKKIGPN